MDKAEEKLREQVANELSYWHLTCQNEPHQTTKERWLVRADQILNLVKEAGLLPVEPVQLEVLSDEGMKSVIKENIALLNHEERSVELLFKVSQATVAHNEAKFGQLYRIKPG